MEWFEKWFGEEYLLVYAHRDADDARKETDAIVKYLSPGKNDRIIDVCCGNGRHSKLLSSLGYDVYGIDLSLPLLKTAVSFNPEDNAAHFVLGDVRRMPFREETFDIAINLFTSFGYFNDNENRDFIASFSSILKNGGKFFIDYINPDCALCNLQERTEREKENLHITETRIYDENLKRLEKTITINENGAEKVFKESLRLYSKEEMTEMLENAGFGIDIVLGSTDGEKYSETSPRMIFAGKKIKK